MRSAPSGHRRHLRVRPARSRPHSGGRLLGVGGAAAGAFDQREVETRDDVLVYTTPPLDQPLEITGPVRVELWAATSAPDTDFTAKLVEVHADGRAINLCDGIVRAVDVRAHTVGRGAAYRFTIELWEISALIPAGTACDSRSRRAITRTSSPTSTAASRSAPTPMPTSGPPNQTVFHDALHPSRLILPVIPR